ncbi:MAG: gfo/Idh/MocA family oxidoreductase [Polaromonas sp.]|nr:gfo/Idh/MocA family oxidoreductase [Polaromonas sp.]
MALQSGGKPKTDRTRLPLHHLLIQQPECMNLVSLLILYMDRQSRNRCLTSGTGNTFGFNRSLHLANRIDDAPAKMTHSQLRLGIAGLGCAFTLMLPTFLQDTRLRLVGATDPHHFGKDAFASDFGAPAYSRLEALCAAPNIEAIYLATPHQFHAEHVCLAAVHDTSMCC